MVLGATILRAVTPSTHGVVAVDPLTAGSYNPRPAE